MTNSDFGRALSISASGLKAQSNRLRHISENIANVDTPGFRRKLINFHEVEAGKVKAGKVMLDQTPLEQVHDPSHPLADANGNYQKSNVNILFEIADAREAQHSYEANLKLFEQSQNMSSSLLDLLKK